MTERLLCSKTSFSPLQFAAVPNRFHLNTHARTHTPTISLLTFEILPKAPVDLAKYFWIISTSYFQPPKREANFSHQEFAAVRS